MSTSTKMPPIVVSYFCFVFGDRVLLICWGWPPTCHPPPSRAAGTTGAHPALPGVFTSTRLLGGIYPATGSAQIPSYFPNPPSLIILDVVRCQHIPSTPFSKCELRPTALYCHQLRKPLSSSFWIIIFQLASLFLPRSLPSLLDRAVTESSSKKPYATMTRLCSKTANGFFPYSEQ